jgi:hypothetical protein
MALIELNPIPKLIELRDQVLESSTKRMPKWKFRLAPNLVAQIQPKVTRPGYYPTQAAVYDCIAVEGENVTANDLISHPTIRPYVKVRFKIFVDRSRSGSS